MRCIAHLLSAALVVTVAAAGSAMAGVIVVDDSSGQNYFTALPNAVAAAVDGDVLLIRPGEYFPVSINNKSLTLQADGPGVFIRDNFLLCIGEAVKVSNLAAGKSVVLRGLSLGAGLCLTNPNLDAFALAATDNQGALWVDSCSIGGFAATNCASITVTNSAMGRVEADSVADLQLHASQLQGFVGEDGYPGYGGPVGGQTGGAALRVQGGGKAFLSGCKLNGGAGGDGYLDPLHGCIAAGSGGSAFHLGAGGPLVRHVGSTVTLGDDGMPAPGCPPPAGAQIATVLSGALIELPGSPGGYVAQSPVRELQPATMTFSDLPGSTVLLFASLNPTSVAAFALAGTLHIGQPAVAGLIGTIPAGGSLTVQVPIPLQSGALLDALVFTQALICRTTGSCTLSPPSVVLLLDQSL